MSDSRPDPPIWSDRDLLQDPGSSARPNGAERSRPGWSLWPRLGRGTRTISYALAVGVLVLVAALVNRHPPVSGSTGAAPAATHLKPTPARATPQVQLLLDQYSFSTRPGEFSLTLTLVNYGTRAVEVLSTELDQAGMHAEPALAGQHPISALTLAPDLSAVVTVAELVSCPAALNARPADELAVTLGSAGRPTEVVDLPLAPLGSLVDDARHAACGVASASATIYPTYVLGSMRVGPAHQITATVAVANVGDAPASVVLLGGGPSSVALGTIGDLVTVDRGHIATLALHWRVLDCLAAGSVRWPTLTLTISVPTSTATNAYGLDQTFGAAWRSALDAACR